MRTIVLGLVAVAVAACAQLVWQKPGGTQQEFDQTRYQCQLQSTSAAPITPTVSGVAGNPRVGDTTIYTTDVAKGERDSLFRHCMEASGWSLIAVKNN